MDIPYLGNVISETNVADLLRTAVDHTPMTTDRDYAFDPGGWANGMLDEIRGTPVEAVAAEALTEMCRAGTPAELGFAALRNQGRGLVPPAVLIDALARPGGRDETVGFVLAAEIARAISSGKTTYDARLRSLVGDARAQGPLLGVMARSDHAFFLASLDRIFGNDAAAATMRAYDAMSGLNHAELVKLAGEIAASALPADVRAAIADAFTQVIADPVTATLTGPLRF